jgi:hypothetical protein
MRRTLYVVNFALTIATCIGWLFVVWGAILEFFLGCLQIICAIIFLAQWRTLSGRTKRAFKLYLTSLGVYGLIVGAACIISENSSSELENKLDGEVAAWFVMGVAILLAFLFTYVCSLAHKDKKEVFMEIDSDVLDSGYIDRSI